MTAEGVRRVQTKDLSDEVMLDAMRRAKHQRDARTPGSPDPIMWPHDMLPDFPAKVVDAKMEQLVHKRIIDCGVTLRSAWIWADMGFK